MKEDGIMRANRSIVSRRILSKLTYVGAVVLWTFCLGQSVLAAKADGKKYNLYFGDLHTHTAYSDAWEGTPWDAYQAAIDAGADYMAVTDHFSAWHAYEGLALDAEEWADTLAAADYFTSKNFVAMAGFEAWLNAHLGEINVYNVRELPAAEPLGYKFDRLTEFYDWLALQPGASGQFNHPYYMTDDFEGYTGHSEARDGAMNIIEVWNGEFTEDSYVMALDAGWHVMPSVNSDTHNPDWIAGYEMRTVLLAEKLTPENLYAAMSARRGYGTLDKNLRISYTLNGEVMGTILPEPDSAYTASIQVSDPDAIAGDPDDVITLVEIVSDGGAVVASLPLDPAASAQMINWTVSGLPADAGYFYVRVSTAYNDVTGLAGVTAWTAPIWTGN
jgi:hypothetical protein